MEMTLVNNKFVYNNSTKSIDGISFVRRKNKAINNKLKNELKFIERHGDGVKAEWNI